MCTIQIAVIHWSSIGLGACLSVVIAAIAGAIWRKGTGIVGGWFSLRHGEIRGTWYAVLAPYGTSKKRVDRMRIHQRGQKIWGQIERVQPRGTNAKWRFDGYVHGNAVVCVFYTMSPKEDPTSYGAINVHRDPADRAVYRGYYTRPDFESYETFIGEGLPRRPIAWQRQHPHDAR